MTTPEAQERARELLNNELRAIGQECMAGVSQGFIGKRDDAAVRAIETARSERAEVEAEIVAWLQGQDTLQYLWIVNVIRRGEYTKCAHDFQGEHTFADGSGSEQVCSKCGLGAMQYDIESGDHISPSREGLAGEG